MKKRSKKFKPSKKMIPPKQIVVLTNEKAIDLIENQSCGFVDYQGERASFIYSHKTGETYPLSNKVENHLREYFDKLISEFECRESDA